MRAKKWSGDPPLKCGRRERRITPAASVRKSAEIRSRIEPNLKEQSAEVLTSLGLGISDAIRLFLQKVVEVQGLPFEVRKLNNAKTVAARIEAREMAAVRFGSAKALFDALENETSAAKTRRATKEI